MRKALEEVVSVDATMSESAVGILRELACWETGPCLTVTVSTDRRHPDRAAERIRLRNTMQGALAQIDALAALHATSAESMADEARRLLDPVDWDPEWTGVAVFVAPGFSRRLGFRGAFPTLSVVADAFVVTPLLRVLAEPAYHVLALDQQGVRLYRGERGVLVDVPVPGMPAGRAEALWYERHEPQLNIHGGSHLGRSGIVGTFHGTESASDVRKQQFVRFARIVDRAVRGAISGAGLPLFVAGIAYELAIYEAVNTNHDFAGTIAVGDPTRLNRAELHDLVSPAIDEYQSATADALRSRLRDAADRLTSIPAVLDACSSGRVAALAVDPTRLVWGPPDASEQRSDRHEGDIELVSAAIGAALRQGASLHPILAGDEFDGSPVVALTRY